jgi:N-methylhydantoinase A
MHLSLGPAASKEAKMEVGGAINAAWEEMEQTALEEMKGEGRDLSKIEFQHLAMIRYAAQLTDLEVQSPVKRINAPTDIDRLIGSWEALYEKINSRVSKYSEVGYQILELGLIARIEKVKARFQERELGSETPDSSASKGSRQVYRDSKWQEAHIWEMDALKPGNVIEGFAIIEHPATTFVVPPGRRVEVDVRNFFWLR